MSNLPYVIALICVVVYLTYRYLTRVYDYWKNKNVNGPTPVFLLGNMADVVKQKTSFVQLVTSFYNRYAHERFIGMYAGRSPVIIVKELDDIKEVLIKDFSNFRNRGLVVIDGPFTKNLFTAEDETWRLLRQRFTSIFTSGKLKNMFHLMDECNEDFHRHLDELVQTNAEPEIRQLMAKYALELLGTCVFGIRLRTLNDDDNIFRYIGAKIFKPRMLVIISRTLDSVFPGIIKLFGIKQHDDEVVDFFMNLVKQLVQEREGKPKIRKDFVDLLLELKEQGSIAGEKNDLEITETLIAAQMVTFYAAGFETSSGTMAFMLHELCLHQDIQERLFREVHSTIEKYNGKLSYEALQEMSFLDMIMSETLRKYAVSGVLIRESAGHYTFSNSKVSIDKGMKVFIPVNALHYDSKYFPEPEKFEPERFSPDNKKNIKPCSYMPFGDGPRNCIATRFAKVQTMVGVASLVHKYRVVPSARTKTNIQFDPKTATLQSRDGIWMKIERR